MRHARWITLALAVGACGKRSDSPPASPPTMAIDATGARPPIDPPPPPPPEEAGDEDFDDQTRGPWVARERGVPPRTPCKPDCVVPTLRPLDGDNGGYPDCRRWAPGVLGTGSSSHSNCSGSSVAIDCCAAIAVDDSPAIPNALGWAKATPEQRVAIAWLAERVAHQALIFEQAGPRWPASAPFAPPHGEARDHAAVLTYWSAHMDGYAMETVWTLERVTYAADGARAREIAQEARRDAPK